jgi:hypothetical protein
MLHLSKRHTLFYGGARSGKTVLVVRAIMMRAVHACGTRHAMLRLRGNAARASLWLDTLPKIQKNLVPAIHVAGPPHGRLCRNRREWFADLDHRRR